MHIRSQEVTQSHHADCLHSVTNTHGPMHVETHTYGAFHSVDVSDRVSPPSSKTRLHRALFHSRPPVGGDRCAVEFRWTAELKKITLFLCGEASITRASMSHLASSWRWLVIYGCRNHIKIVRLIIWQESTPTLVLFRTRCGFPACRKRRDARKPNPGSEPGAFVFQRHRPRVRTDVNAALGGHLGPACWSSGFRWDGDTSHSSSVTPSSP